MSIWLPTLDLKTELVSRESRTASGVESTRTIQTMATASLRVGKTVGTLDTGRHENLTFAAKSEEVVEVNGGFHQTQNAVKHISKPFIYWGFCNLSMNTSSKRTMANQANQAARGELRGEGFASQEEISNG